ncbi:MAG: Ryanodine receptor Ryr [Ruminiclostridium sp.]|jgi:RyR domain.|nr:Ryanodine receptor Ryr [Ruminiclostridium sp.]
MYIPKPKDTSNIVLDDELLALTEVIAENVHEMWAKKRLSEGWKYGEERDGAKKTTPCLVPYDELDEIEKEYDRSTALETIKLVISLGYTIEKKK